MKLALKLIHLCYVFVVVGYANELNKNSIQDLVESAHYGIHVTVTENEISNPEELVEFLLVEDIRFRQYLESLAERKPIAILRGKLLPAVMWMP